MRCNSLLFVLLVAALLIEVLWRWRSLPIEPVEFAVRPSCSVFPEAAGPLGRDRWECYQITLTRPEMLSVTNADGIRRLSGGK